MSALKQSVKQSVLSHPLLFVFVVAISIRLVVAIAVAVFHNGSYFPDDSGYLDMAGEWARSETEDWTVGMDGLWTGNASFLVPVGVFFYLFGSYPILGQVLSVVAGSVVATGAVALVRPHVSRGASVLTGCIIAILPSQILWSSLILKDAFSWMSLVLIGLTLRWWNKQRNTVGWAKGFFLLACLTFYLAHLRVHTLITACIAIAISIALTVPRQRLARLGAVLILVAVMPISAGAGLFGVYGLPLGGGGLASKRASLAAHANTAVVEWEMALADTAEELPVQPIIKNTVSASNGASPAAHANTAAVEWEMAWAYTAERPPAQHVIKDTISAFPADLLYLPKGLRVILIDPLPNHLKRSPNLKYPFAELLLWYPMLVLGLFGGWAIVKQRNAAAGELVYALFVIGGLAIMWGMVEGNFGTAYRHRGELVWGIAVLDGIGIDYLLSRRQPSPTAVEKQ